MQIKAILSSVLALALVADASRSLGPGSKEKKYGRRSTASRRSLGRRDQPLEIRKSHIISPKIFIISLFSSEGDIWYEEMPELYAQNITVPGLSPLFPEAHCVADGSVCQMITGEGEINAASSVSALMYSSIFDLKETYFLIAGIAGKFFLLPFPLFPLSLQMVCSSALGVNPHMATTGSVTFSKYAVQFDLQYEFAESQIPSNYTSGWFPQDADFPDVDASYDYPGEIYGTEVFELNSNLRDRMLYLAKQVTLYDTDSAAAYRANYDYAPANQPPSVVACDTGTSNNYWSGSVLGYAFGNYTKLLTNGSGEYCATQQEDNAICEAILRADIAGKADFSRLIIMRTASDFDRAYPGEDEVYHLIYAEQEGFEPSIQNIWNVGSRIVEDVKMHWKDTYQKGIKPGNYIGDAFDSLVGDIAPDIGTEDIYIN